MAPRAYAFGRRRAASDATRARIIEATRTLLGGKGDILEFSMETVADKASVSRMTVYNQFRSRTGLLDALADSLAEKGGMHRMAGVFMEPDPEVALRKFVSTFVGLWASDRVLLRRLRAMGLLVPGVYRGVRDRDEWRRQAARNLLTKVGARRTGRPTVDREDSAALLASMTSFEVFDALCTDRRPPEAVAQLLADAVVELLVPTPPTPRAPTARRARSS
ncbi:MAG: TetR/AcrR family transcriptional regulator [Thermoplasmata archaeon]|nr:TetR/AcrR family transcriptional regulator [Thermoplasmata archaeon]